jgi:hypothetical protein
LTEEATEKCSTCCNFEIIYILLLFNLDLFFGFEMRVKSKFSN